MTMTEILLLLNLLQRSIHVFRQLVIAFLFKIVNVPTRKSPVENDP